MGVRKKVPRPVIRDRGFRFIQKPYDLVDLLGAIKDELEKYGGARIEKLKFGPQ